MTMVLNNLSRAEPVTCLLTRQVFLFMLRTGLSFVVLIGMTLVDKIMFQVQNLQYTCTLYCVHHPKSPSVTIYPLDPLLHPSAPPHPAVCA